MEEKRKRMVDWFHESQSFHQLKDVEKLCSSEKGNRKPLTQPTRSVVIAIVFD